MIKGDSSAYLNIVRTKAISVLNEGYRYKISNPSSSGFCFLVNLNESETYILTTTSSLNAKVNVYDAHLNLKISGSSVSFNFASNNIYFISVTYDYSVYSSGIYSVLCLLVG